MTPAKPRPPSNADLRARLIYLIHRVRHVGWSKARDQAAQILAKLPSASLRELAEAARSSDDPIPDETATKEEADLEEEILAGLADLLPAERAALTTLLARDENL